MRWNGILRISTLFQYPDRSFIDLFLEEDFGGGYILSDLGETASYLSVNTAKKQQVVSDICESLRIELEKGQLQIKITTDNLRSIPEAMMRLGQACVIITYNKWINSKSR